MMLPPVAPLAATENWTLRHGHDRVLEHEGTTSSDTRGRGVGEESDGVVLVVVCDGLLVMMTCGVMICLCKMEERWCDPEEEDGLELPRRFRHPFRTSPLFGSSRRGC
jgi:hypothetical protein